MQAASSSSEEKANGQNASLLGNVKVSVSDLVSDEFKKAWLVLKDIHDKELHCLQMKLSTMRKARLSEVRRINSAAKTKPGTKTWEGSESKSCEHCLKNETYRKLLQQEFSYMQQKSLVEIAELTVENNRLKEENRKLSEKINANMPRVDFSSSDSNCEDFIPNTQVKPKQVYVVRDPSQPVQLFPSHATEPHNEPKQSLSDLDVDPNLHDIPLHSQDIFEVPETSMDSLSVEENLAQEANALLSCRDYLTTTLDNSKKDDVISVSSLSQVQEMTPTQKGGKNTFNWSLSSVSSEEVIIVSETPEENMPRGPSNVLTPLTKKTKSNSAQVFPVDTSKHIQKRRLARSGFSYNDDIPMTSSSEHSKETPLKNTGESENVSACEKPRSHSQIVSSGSVLKRKIKK